MKSVVLIFSAVFAVVLSELTQDQKSCEDSINSSRVLGAMKDKIANMNEVKYDEDLEERAEKVKHPCSVGSVDEIKKDEMYSTSSSTELPAHVTATKAACVLTYCDNYKQNKTIYVVDKGPGGEEEGESGSKCAFGESKDVGGLCALSRSGTQKVSIIVLVMISSVFYL